MVEEVLTTNWVHNAVALIHRTHAFVALDRGRRSRGQRCLASGRRPKANSARRSSAIHFGVRLIGPFVKGSGVVRPGCGHYSLQTQLNSS